MKRKAKRKKDSSSPKSTHITKDESSNELKGNDSQVEESRAASRSSSQRTRSLSSIFRRSRDRQRRARSESSERSKSRGASSGGTELSDPHGFNPRTEPRDHLRKMTVREALAESRTRGRSPNRRAIYNLEKRIMSPGQSTDKSTDNSMSASLSNIPDQIPLLDRDDVDITDGSNSKITNPYGSGIKRCHSEVKNDTNFITNNTQNKEEFLPLDKRKYIINKENANMHTDSILNPTNQSDKNKLHEADVHTPNSSRDPSPYSMSAFANQEHQRRESFGRFLQLRETRPPRSSSSMSIGRQSIDSLTGSDDRHAPSQRSETTHASPSNVSVLEDGTRVTLPTYDEVMAESTSLPAGRRTFNPSAASKFKAIKSKDEGAIPKVKEGNRNNIDKNVQMTNEKERERKESRSSFVSPRRFTRGPRNRSDSSQRSLDTNMPEEEVMVANKVQSQSESAPRRYQRKFSNSSEKRRKISGQSDIAPQGLSSTNNINSRHSNSNPPAMIPDFPNKTVDNLSTIYNNEIKNPKPTKPQSVSTDTIEKGKEMENSNIASIDFIDDSDLNTGLSDMASKIQEAMNTVNNEPLVTPFPDDDCEAVPLDSITDGIPFKVRTNSEHDRKISETNSGQSKVRSKRNSDSKKYSSNSETELINVDNLEDILMQDDVFETNIDEISLRSGGKIVESANQSKDTDSVKERKSSSETEKSKHDSRHSSSSDKPEEKSDSKMGSRKSQKKDGKSKKESKKGKKKKGKASENESSKDTVNIENDDKSEDINKKRKLSKKDKKELKKSKSKKSSSAPNISSEVAKIKELKEVNIDEKHLENDKLVKLDDGKEKEQKPKAQKRKSFFRRSKRSVSRTSSVKDAIIKVGRAASLSNILDTPEMQRANRKPSLVKTDSLHRSHSVEEISSLKYNKIEPINLNIPDSIFNRRSAKDAIWNIQTQLPKQKEKKQPKLSLSAIISMRAKVGRYKKAKASRDKEETESKEPIVPDTPAQIECNNEEEDKEQSNDNPEQCDKDVANIVYENEVNVSLNKQHDTPNTETMIIEDDLDNEIANIVHEKKIHFDSFLNEQQLSEEELIKQRQRNTRLTGRRESKVRQRQKRVISCCKKLIAFLFSHIGLCSLVVAYCIAGGFIFKTLEGNGEIEKKKEMQAVREDYTTTIFNLAFQNRFSKRSAMEFKYEVEEILRNYSLKIYRETKEAGWDGKDSTNEPEQWSFPSSLLYAITVMTTIGYGHVAPKTPYGRIVTIGYAVLGIPLTLLCLTNIGDVMAKGFRMLYGKVFCGLCCVLFRPSRKRRLHDPERGIPVGEERMVVQEEEKSEEIIHVPTSVCLLLMSAYVLLGTWAFCEWEKWDMITGTYFCFITLSTIGFGDVVPGMTSDKWDMNEKLVLCALYLILGLSLIAMCFNLVQEDVKAKCKWLGMKLGIIDKPVTSV